MMAGPLSLPVIIPLALGAALGGADALCVLLQFAGQSPLLDIAICILAMGMVTAYLLGAVLVVRFVRDTRPGLAPAAGHSQDGGTQAQRAAAMEECFAKMTLVVSVGVAFLVAGCLLVVGVFVDASGSGRPHARSTFPWRSPMVDTPICVTAVVAVAVAVAVLLTQSGA